MYVYIYVIYLNVPMYACGSTPIIPTHTYIITYIETYARTYNI